MMDMPEVTVIMNCLNGERYLREALDSVYAQTYKNWKIIFWDNASTDSTADIANSYDSRLEYYCAESTTDLGVARVKASKQANGELLAFLDCDDVWHETKLEMQVEMFCESTEELGVVYGRTQGKYESDSSKDRVFYDGQNLPEGWVFPELVKENFIAFSSAMVDRKKFFECGGFPSHFKNSTDYWVFVRMAQRYKFRALQTVCCDYRIHSSNLSASHYILGITESISAVSQLLPNRDALAGLRHLYLQLALMHLKEGQVLSAIGIIFRKRVFLLLIRWIWGRYS